MNNFSKLGLSQSIVDVLDSLGFENPTPVQEKSIPLLLTKNPTDFIGLAQTGTGKTAAFGLPLIDLIEEDNKSTQALVMAPTRELGQQTGKQLVDFSSNNKAVNVEVVYGGAAITNQIKALRKPTQIIVATPGRLLDLIKRRAVKLENVKYVVLDEADEMLNMGFKEDIDEILSHTLESRVTWLFSATMPPEIRRIVKKYMKDPIEVAVNTEQKSNVDISHKYVMTKSSNKIAALRRFLDIQPDMRGIMFCRTKRETQQIADDLGNLGYGVEALHGDLSQGQRDAVMKRFKTRSMQLLIATDVAARGIDVNDLTHVFHHTLPDQLESYTHRSGRTGRAGNKGTSLVFINPREGRRITDLERKIKVKFERVEIPSVEALKSSRIHNWASLIINTQVDPQSESILTDVQDRFAHLSKEDLLKRLITTQLDHLMVQEGEENNLNETHGGSPDKRDRSGFSRYFINVGSIDGMTKADLVHFMSDIANVDRKYFGDITMQKNRSYVDIDSSQDRGLSLKFEGVEIEGRSIRVNRDDQGDRRNGADFKKSKNRRKPRPERDRRKGRRRR
ncbi:DEAD/DEAH box helicase [Marinoscillum furvescens]|uniref:ATP-dependent RNA helicase DeaD n=1 Tax=Marinoscillum furvescens DSM 4134 TaxID=1122208 RepID=A0A3D9KYN8_MARFU|nr:DEAD/DEAH box helicase [Marinoscillum furvescens]RED94911.1 ATP-dependent RNA helicase DeaD [Marinoscillum furvescens DSM 4134]